MYHWILNCQNNGWLAVGILKHLLYKYKDFLTNLDCTERNFCTNATVPCWCWNQQPGNNSTQSPYRHSESKWSVLFWWQCLPYKQQTPGNLENSCWKLWKEKMKEPGRSGLGAARQQCGPEPREGNRGGRKTGWTCIWLQCNSGQSFPRMPVT